MDYKNKSCNDGGKYKNRLFLSIYIRFSINIY